MFLTSAPPLHPPSNYKLCGDGWNESVYFGRRRVSLMVTALFLLLVCGRAPHFHYLLIHWSGDHAASVEILGNALVLGVYAFVASAALMSAVLGFPRLIVAPRGLTRRSLFRTTSAEWDSLSRFHVDQVVGEKATFASADIIGPKATPRLLRRKDKLFTIRSTYRRPVLTIVTEIHNRQTEALGVPAPLPRAVGMPAIREYGVAGFRIPWTTLGLLVILTAAFVAEHRLGVAPEEAPFKPDVLTLYAFGGLRPDAILKHGELLRLFSSTLLHLSKVHFLGNAAALLLVGWTLEWLVGRSWLVGLFAVSSLAGSLLALAIDPADVTLVGASGGIAGLLGATVVLSFRLPIGRKRTLMIACATLVLISTLMAPGGIYTGLPAHLGGLFGGAALGTVLLSTWNKFCRQPRFRAAGLAIGAGGLALALLGITTSLLLSRDFVASVQHCAASDPDTRIHSCTALLDSGMGTRFTMLWYRGSAYMARRQYDLAIDDFDGVIALAPRSGKAFVNRGKAYAEKGLNGQAILDFTKAIELDPTLANAYLDRGSAYLHEKLVDLAISDEDQATTLDPELAGAFATRGMAYSRKGETAEAIADYSKAIALNQGDANSHFNRSVEYLRANRFDEAIADATMALKLRPENAAAYNNRAWALHLSEKNALALPDADKAVALAPDSVYPLETRAEIYEKLGRKRDAIADYRAALAIDGGLQLARDGLNRLNADPGSSQ